jgi:iron-sulfur cluster repair protein YtfE (RIC family)
VVEGETSRLVAWSHELRRVHGRLRQALRLAQEAFDEGGDLRSVTRELLLYCHGFCAALDEHHRAEDRTLFPAIEAGNPQLRPALRSLQQDHSMIAHLLAGLREATERAESLDELVRHLEGVAAIMENHFRYEERTLLGVLESLELDATTHDALGSF